MVCADPLRALRLCVMSAKGPHQLLTYHYVEDVLARRGPHRPGHLGLIDAWREEGRLVVAGAVGDPPRRAMFLFSEDADLEAFRAADPYVANGLVTDWAVEPIRLV